MTQPVRDCRLCGSRADVMLVLERRRLRSVGDPLCHPCSERVLANWQGMGGEVEDFRQLPVTA